MKKPDYPIPTTNAEGLALVWTKIYPAELARQLSVLAFERDGPGGKTLSRAAASKWKAVPLDRVKDVAEITGLDPRHIVPELAHVFETSK